MSSYRVQLEHQMGGNRAGLRPERQANKTLEGTLCNVEELGLHAINNGKTLEVFKGKKVTESGEYV